MGSKLKKYWFVVAALILAVVAVVLAVASSQKNIDTIVNSEVTENLQEIKEEKPKILFNGYLQATVDESDPYLRLSNPSDNFVNFQFEVRNPISSELLYTSDLVEPGKYTDVNVMEHYTEPGDYTLMIVTYTFDIETNQSMDGITQEIKLIVK